MVLLTGNRSMKGDDSLEQTLREENTPEALPVITIAGLARLDERGYRERCSLRLLEIMLDIDQYRGTRRVFIPRTFALTPYIVFPLIKNYYR
jgi:hypothetical protein